MCFGFFFFKQKTAYEMRISDWSSDVCSSDLTCRKALQSQEARTQCQPARLLFADRRRDRRHRRDRAFVLDRQHDRESRWNAALYAARTRGAQHLHARGLLRSEEHTSELQSLMRISSAGFCLKKNNNITTHSI